MRRSLSISGTLTTTVALFAPLVFVAQASAYTGGAVANGGSTQAGQGFSPGDQIISWDYSSLLVNITGDVWAVSAGPTQLVFDGLINIFLILNDSEAISVTGTMLYDNAPGGYRGSMAQMDSTEAPYGCCS